MDESELCNEYALIWMEDESHDDTNTGNLPITTCELLPLTHASFLNQAFKKYYLNVLTFEFYV